ncbi:MAG TPA: DUF2723 domain-containing protein [Vicinamibacterales bacterium]|nr:DUF2723 domain-containing protein [Vicinamibacterales bacterium]
MLSKRDVTLATLVAIVTLTFFIITLRPDVGGTEDSPKFQFVGQALGTAHSPGYPFYVMATYAFTRVPIGTLAYRVNLFSAVCGALACMCIFLTARRLGVTSLLSIAAALAAATSYPVWSNSVTAEVYTLAAVLSGFAVYWLIAFAQTPAVWPAAREASDGEVSTVRPSGRGVGRLYAACAMWACGFGNHLTIVGILPAALIYGIYKDRSVLRPRVAITAAIIGLIGVAQYWFIAIRTMQGAPYLEARADTIRGVFDVIIARDVSWARFYQAQSAVAAIEVPMLLNGIRIHMGTVPIILVVIAIAIGIWKKNAEVLLILGAAGGTLGMIANLWGDVVGFITPVCVQLWPLAALGLQMLVMRMSASSSALAVAGLIAMIVPVTNAITNWPSIEMLRTPGEGPGVRALYARLPSRSAVVAENYWLARLVNYMHFSGEYQPDPNPRVLDSDANDVRAAIADGLEVYAFEGATQWLNAQGFRFERTDVAREPFETWIARQPRGTLIVAASAGRPLPIEWLPPSTHTSGGRANYGAFAWTVGEPRADVAQEDSMARIDRGVGSEGRVLTISSSDEGPQIALGGDVLTTIDRGLAVAAFSPGGQLAGQWAFALDDKPGVQLPPTPYVLRGEAPCEVLRPGVRTDVSNVLADGGWWATVEGKGQASIAIASEQPPATWRHRVSSGRGTASIDGERSRVTFEAVPGTRSVFRLSMPPGRAAAATLDASDITAVRVCRDSIPLLPASGALDVGAQSDAWFGAGWHLGERGGIQRFRWSQRASTLAWKMEKAAPIRVLLRLRSANANGATIQAAINGTALPSCALRPGAWTDCKFEWPATMTRPGINQLTLNADTMSPSADRPGDSRELSFVMQPSRVRVGY